MPGTWNGVVDELLARSSGPLHLRLLIQPLVATSLAIRAGLRDARAGRPPFLWTLASDRGARRQLLRSAWADLGKLLILALALDCAWQLLVLGGFRPLEALAVATCVAAVPYALVRGLVTRLARRGPRRSADRR